MRHTDGVFIPGNDRSDDNYLRVMKYLNFNLARKLKMLFFFYLFTVIRYHRLISRQYTFKNRIRVLQKLIAGE